MITHLNFLIYLTVGGDDGLGNVSISESTELRWTGTLHDRKPPTGVCLVPRSQRAQFPCPEVFPPYSQCNLLAKKKFANAQLACHQNKHAVHYVDHRKKVMAGAPPSQGQGGLKCGGGGSPKKGRGGWVRPLLQSRRGETPTSTVSGTAL